VIFRDVKKAAVIAFAFGILTACGGSSDSGNSGTVSEPNPDSLDGDSITDTEDNCPAIANEDQLDTDADGESDACDADDDNDGSIDTDDCVPTDATAFPGATEIDGDGIDNDCDGIVDSGTTTATGLLQAYLKADTPTEQGGYSLAASLSADGNTLAISASNTSTGGAVFLYTRSGTTWAQQAVLNAANTERGDELGSSVSLSADGNTLAVGAQGDASANAAGTGNDLPSAGAVHVFMRTGTNWTRQAYLKADTIVGSSNFGSSVGLSDAGDRLVVGAFSERAGSTPGVGAAYVFTLSGSTWSQQARLATNASDRDDWFGRPAIISGDGNTIALGVLQEDSNATGINGDEENNSAQRAGAAYVYAFDGSSWSQQAYIKAGNAGEGESFGRSLDLTANGDLLVISADNEPSLSTGVNGDPTDKTGYGAGAVYVFTRSGGNWMQQAYLKASNTEGNDRPDGNFFGDSFGIDVALSDDGSFLAVGALNEQSAATGLNGDQTNNDASGSGAVYFFSQSNDTWEQTAYLKASNTDAGDAFGLNLQVSGDGTTLVVGAFGEDGGAGGINGNDADNSVNASGAAYVYWSGTGL
jgi:hypothetical protein